MIENYKEGAFTHWGADMGWSKSVQVLSMLKERSHSDQPPDLTSDGWGGHWEALEVYGHVLPYKERGRPPTWKKPQLGWQYM